MSDKQEEQKPSSTGEGGSGSKTPPIPTTPGDDAMAAESSSSGGAGSRRGSQTEKISSFVSNIFNKLSFGSSSTKPKILEDKSIQGVVNYMQSEKCKNIVVMAGAGISTSAGIPDFRSPGCGLYDNIQRKYNLTDPQCMFEISYFRKNPEPFYSLAKELFPQELTPTPAHNFVRLLHNKGLLLRHYTQNIDGLERIAGVPSGKIVEAHGSFHTSHCMKSSCRKEYSFDWMKEKITLGSVPKCIDCQSTVKPDVVFFGESLSPRFFSSAMNDFPKCDLLLIMGTSLIVQPFAHLVNQVSSDTPRVLINREVVGVGSIFSKGLDFKSDKNRDVAILGDCDEGVRQLAEALGWKDELEQLQKDASYLADTKATTKQQNVGTESGASK